MTDPLLTALAALKKPTAPKKHGEKISYLTFCFSAASLMSSSIMLAWLRSFFSLNNFSKRIASEDRAKDVLSFFIHAVIMW